MTASWLNRMMRIASCFAGMLFPHTTLDLSIAMHFPGHVVAAAALYRSSAARFCFCLGLICFLALGRLPSRAGSPNWQGLTYSATAPGMDWNPVRGLVPYPDTMNSTFPHGLVFNYLSLRSLMTSSNTFNWAALESYLNSTSAAGYPAVVRIYLDYPDKPVGTPQFLIDQGVTMRDYNDYSNGVDNRSKAPDWNDSRVITASQQFIAAFGAAYDGDQRIGAVQVGLYGFWGEWHTYPYDGTNGHANWQMNQANKDLILTAFKNAFSTTQLVLRDPAGTGNASLKTYFGYHDDSFAYETITSDPNLSYYFWPKMQVASLQNQWKSRMMGGELRPELQTQHYWASWPNAVGEDWTTCVNTVHPSWMLAEGAFNGSLSSTEWNNALRGHRMLGYQLYASQVQLPNTAQRNTLSVGVKLKNMGDAPPPYNWACRFSVLNSSNSIISTPWGDVVDLQLQSIQPDGTEYTRTFSKSNHGLAVGDYTMVFQVRHPLSNGKVALANSTMGQNLSGWLTLGSFSVGPSVETENLAVSATLGDTHRVQADSGASGGALTILDSNAVGDYVTYTIPNLQARTYEIYVGTKKYNTRGICQLAVAPSTNGTYTDHGAPFDLYNSTATFAEIDVGSFTPGTSGDKAFRFTVTGKNAGSSGYFLAFDYITLVPQ